MHTPYRFCSCFDKCPEKNMYIPQVVDLSSGSMEKLSLKMGSSEKEEEEDNSVVVRHQVCSL